MAGVILDAGHGGYDNGAQYSGRKEKDDNLRLALAVGEILARNGIPVMYISHHRRKQESGMQAGQIILFLFTEIPVQTPISTTGWKHWYLMTAGSRLRWHEM